MCFSCLLHFNFWSEIRWFFFRIMYLFESAKRIVYLRLCQVKLIVIDAKFPSVAIKTKRTKNKAYFTEKLYSSLPATHIDSAIFRHQSSTHVIGLTYQNTNKNRHQRHWKQGWEMWLSTLWPGLLEPPHLSMLASQWTH